MKDHVIAARTVLENLTNSDFFIKHVKESVSNRNYIIQSRQDLANALSDGVLYYPEFDAYHYADVVDQIYPLST